MPRFPLLLFLAALAAIVASLWELSQSTRGIAITAIDIDGTPATLFTPQGATPENAVVIAHGFAGSQQLMRSFALAFARNGIAAITFDLLGHGRNPAPLTGNLEAIDGATRRLVAETQQVIAYAREHGAKQVALLGHSMASDVVVRTADATPGIAATIAVSMFSPAVTATVPRNLLVIVGDWEPGLKAEALRAVGLATAPQPARTGETSGSFADGTARRVVFAPHVEHVSVLFSETALREAVIWASTAFGSPIQNPAINTRGPWLLVLIAGLVLIVRPLSLLLPVVAQPPAGRALPWRTLLPAMTVAALGTPLVLRIVPTTFLPVLVADYLVVHFAVFGILFAAAARLLAGPLGLQPPTERFVLAATLLSLLTTGLLAPALDKEALSFLPTGTRWLLIAVLLSGTLPFFAAVEWLTRGPNAVRWGYALTQVAFILSLALAIAFDFERLFFLIIIVPVIAIFLVVVSLYSRWSFERTGDPMVAAVANALLFAVAIGVTFPLVAP
ncbi:MAG: alpha/beta fold hydrolase [Hyphomicrobiales bacterium]